MMHLRCLQGCQQFKLLAALSVATLLMPMLAAQAQPPERPRPPRASDESGSRTRDELLRTLSEMQKMQKQMIDMMTENQKKMDTLRQRLADTGRRSETPRPDAGEGRGRRGPPSFPPDFRERMERFRQDRQRGSEKPPAADKPAERKPAERKPSERRRPAPERKPEDVEQRLERLLKSIEDIRKELKEAKGQQ